MFFLLQDSRTAVGPISSLGKWMPRAVSSRGKLPGLEIHHSPPSGTVVKHVWSHTFSPLYIYDVYAGTSPNLEATDVYFLHLFSYLFFPPYHL
jgi:hypothetical protein